MRPSRPNRRTATTPGLAPVSSIRRSRVSSPSNAPCSTSSSGSLAAPARLVIERAAGLLDLGLERAALVLGRDHGEAHAGHHEQADDERAEFDLERSQAGPAVAEDSEPRGDAVDERRRQLRDASWRGYRRRLRASTKADLDDLEDRGRPWGRARVTLSPTAFPNNARATGEETEMQPLTTSDSSSPRIV